MAPLVSVDPTTGERIAQYEPMARATIDAALVSAHRAQGEWAAREVEDRTEPLLRLAGWLREEAPALAELMAREMGKPLAQGRAEVDKCARACEHVAATAAHDLANERVATEAALSWVAFRPLGIVLAVMPWNFPLWQVIRCAVPALAAGNAVLLKHASNVTGCALELERGFAAAHLPEGLFRTLLCGHDEVARLIASPLVRAVSLTGSTEAGRDVGRRAGEALKKVVLELGGSDAYVVLEDADLDLAACTCAESRLINAGQSCIAAKRFVVVESVREAFTERLVARMAARRVGAPLDEGTEVGPLARRDLRDALHDQVQRSLAAGARVRLGGEVPPGPGAFYPPTVLDRVGPGQPAFEEELFGPVAAVVSAQGEREAVELANATPFGLGAAVFTSDAARGARIAERELEAGSCFVNALVRSDPRLPFGGVKDSGLGRELSRFGIREFVNVKTVWTE